MTDNSSDLSPYLSWKLKDPELTELALKEFTEKFSSDNHCIEEIVTRLKADWCRFCGSISVERGFGKRRLRCRDCYKYSWVFAGSFFERMKLPRLYLGAIFLMEQGITFSANALADWFGTAYATAFELLKKLRLIATSVMGVLTEVSMRVFEKVLLRRCLETPAEKHPSELPENEAGEIKSSTLEADEHAPENEEGKFEENKNLETSEKMSALEESIAGLLTATPTSFDELIAISGCKSSELNVALTMLEFAGIAKRIPGDRYIRQKSIAGKFQKTHEKEQEKFAARINSFIKHYYGGISRRYLQYYIGSFWINASHAKFGELKLFDAVAEYGLVTGHLLERIRSNLVVLIP